jgi:uncharacterized RDD family membrane protein YckC
MDSKKCPRCGLYNSSTALRCACGYRFAPAAAATPVSAVLAPVGPALVPAALPYRPVVPAVPASGDAGLLGQRFGRRAAAYVIDFIFYAAGTVAATFAADLILLVPVLVVTRLTGQRFTFVNGGAALVWLNDGINLVAMTLFFAIPEWLYGATLGKVLLGMRVVKPTGERCDLKGALVRSVARYIDGLFCGLIAYAEMKPPLYQRLGNKWGQTVVVRAGDPAIKQPREWWWFLVATAIYLAMHSGLLLLYFIIAARPVAQ